MTINNPEIVSVTPRTYTVTLTSGVIVHNASRVSWDEITSGVLEALAIQLGRTPSDFAITVAEEKREPDMSALEFLNDDIQKHDYESPRGVAGPILECAVCGRLRSAPVHG